jgi:hypothetical protein
VVQAQLRTMRRPLSSLRWSGLRKAQAALSRTRRPGTSMGIYNGQHGSVLPYTQVPGSRRRAIHQLMHRVPCAVAAGTGDKPLGGM